MAGDISVSETRSDFESKLWRRRFPSSSLTVRKARVTVSVEGCVVSCLDRLQRNIQVLKW
jgi:hypothetical protein